MSDLIDRDETYNVLTEYYHHNTDAQHMALHEALSKVPSAEKYARWEYVDYGGIGNWHCSACHGISMIKFENCPYCGAKMVRGTKNG